MREKDTERGRRKKMPRETKKEILNEIYKLAGKVNAGIEELERTGYKESSFAYDRVEDIRFEAPRFINKKGQFRKSSKLTKDELLREREHLRRLANMKTLTSAGIRKAIDKNFESGFKAFNKKLKKAGEKTLTKQEYAKIRHDFAQRQELKLSEVIGSDTLVDLSKLTQEEEIEQLFEDVSKMKYKKRLIDKFIKQRDDEDAKTWSEFFEEYKQMSKENKPANKRGRGRRRMSK